MLGITPYFHINGIQCSLFYTLNLYFTLSPFTTYFEYGIAHFKKKKPLAVWQLRNKHVVDFFFSSRKTRSDLGCMKGSDSWWHLCLSVCGGAHGTGSGGFTGWVGLPFAPFGEPPLAALEQNRLPAPEETNGYRAWPSSSAAPATASPVAGISLPPMCYIRLAWSGSETVNTPQFRKSAKFAETKRQYRK